LITTIQHKLISFIMHIHIHIEGIKESIQIVLLLFTLIWNLLIDTVSLCFIEFSNIINQEVVQHLELVLIVQIMYYFVIDWFVVLVYDISQHLFYQSLSFRLTDILQQLIIIWLDQVYYEILYFQISLTLTVYFVHLSQ